MHKLTTLVLAPLLCVGLVACNNDTSEIDTSGTIENSVTETGKFTEDVARTVHGQINDVLHNPSSTEQELLKYATPNFITQLGKEYGGYSYNEIHQAVNERSQYWEHDEPLNETFQSAIDSGITAMSQRVLTTNNYNYVKAPESETCTIYDSWIKDADGWKLDFVDDTDCR